MNRVKISYMQEARENLDLSGLQDYGKLSFCCLNPRVWCFAVADLLFHLEMSTLTSTWNRFSWTGERDTAIRGAVDLRSSSWHPRSTDAVCCCVCSKLWLLPATLTVAAAFWWRQCQGRAFRNKISATILGR